MGSTAAPCRAEELLRGSALNNISPAPSPAPISFASETADRKQRRTYSADRPCDACEPSGHQGTVWPRQSKNPPLASAGSWSMTASKWRAAAAGECTSNPVAANGADNAVATVPGCKAMQSASEDRRANSTAAVRTSWLRAALDARYEYQPPSRLSPMLPTRADSVAKTALPDRGKRGSTCFMISAGPIAFSAKERVRWAASSCRQLFSGPC